MSNNHLRMVLFDDSGKCGRGDGVEDRNASVVDLLELPVGSRSAGTFNEHTNPSKRNCASLCLSASPFGGIIVTVTIIDSGNGAEESTRCGWCRRPIDQTVGRGRPKKFCKQSCRQRDYESRERSKAHGLADGELIMTRSELDAMRDNAYVLACAVRDVERDLTEKPTLQDYKDAVQWLVDAAKPLTSSGPLS